MLPLHELYTTPLLTDPSLLEAYLDRPAPGEVPDPAAPTDRSTR
jgi:hypothetical protein